VFALLFILYHFTHNSDIGLNKLAALPPGLLRNNIKLRDLYAEIL
jgi:hypothetical protein